jgi:hypothetical protein
MAATMIFAPFTAVRLAWAISAKFSSDPDDKVCAQAAEENLKSMSAQASTDPKERSYVSQSVATVQATVRSLEIIYKGRELNFKENEKLREAYMENVKDGIQFGSKAKDYLKALPTMALAGPGVAGTLGPTLFKQISVAHGNETLFLWGLGVAMAGLGYLIHAGFVRFGRKRTQMLYIAQDYERNLYYDQYIGRVVAALTGLYQDIDRLHEQAFGSRYPIGDGNAASVVADLLRGVGPTMCKHVHEHMRKGVVTPEDWTMCEVGESHSRSCPRWDQTGPGRS